MPSLLILALTFGFGVSAGIMLGLWLLSADLEKHDIRWRDDEDRS